MFTPEQWKALWEALQGAWRYGKSVDGLRSLSLSLSGSQSAIDEKTEEKTKSFDIALGIKAYLYSFSLHVKAITWNDWPDEMVKNGSTWLSWEQSFFSASFGIAIQTFKAMSPDGIIHFNLKDLEEQQPLHWFTLVELKYVRSPQNGVLERTRFYDFDGVTLVPLTGALLDARLRMIDSLLPLVP